jgi:AcrR family transcriptional regulator
MSRPRNAHEDLLAATGKLTYRRGITATGVDAIAAEAGVTKRTLYQHFGSKDSLVSESLRIRSHRSLPALEESARQRAEETGEPAVLAIFDVIENALSKRAKVGCAFINAALEIKEPDHPVRKAAVAHLEGREQLVRKLAAEAGVADPGLAGQIALLVEGAFAVGGSRRDPAAAQRAKSAAATLLASRTR